MQLDLVFVCVRLASLRSPWHFAPLFTALPGSSLHSNSAIMQPVCGPTATQHVHDGATTVDCVLTVCLHICVISGRSYGLCLDKRPAEVEGADGEMDCSLFTIID